MTRDKRNLWLLAVLVAAGLLALYLLPACVRHPKPSDREAENLASSAPNLASSGDSAAIKKRTEKQPENKPAQDPRKGIFSFLSRPKSEKKTGKVKLKNVTIQQVIGDNNKVAAGDTKLKDSQQASDSATLTSSGTGNAANVSGDGNKLEQKAENTTDTRGPAWLRGLKVAGVLAITGFGIYQLWPLFAAWRRRQSNKNT